MTTTTIAEHESISAPQQPLPEAPKMEPAVIAPADAAPSPDVAGDQPPEIKWVPLAAALAARAKAKAFRAERDQALVRIGELLEARIEDQKTIQKLKGARYV